MSWEERTIDDAFTDVSQFASDLTTSLQNRLASCVNDDIGKLKFFDIEQVFMSGQRLPNKRVKIKGNSEVFEAERFARSFKEICNLKQIIELNDERFDKRLHQSVFRNWKDALRVLVWDEEMKHELLSCLVEARDSDVVKTVATDPEAHLMKLSIEPGEASKVNLQTLFKFEFENHAPFLTFIDEAKITMLFFTIEILYSKAGPVAMTAFDIALSMGGSEAIIESFYSVMDTQRQVRQQHST